MYFRMWVNYIFYALVSLK